MLDCPTEPEVLKNWIIDQSVFIYQMSEHRNDFFLLHGITCSWALSNIIPLMKSEETKKEILQTFLCILLGVYVAQDRPKLVPQHLEAPDVGSVSWDDIIGRTLKQPSELDEHEYKLVQVCYEASFRNPGMSDILKRACLTVHYFDFYFGTKI